jgi:hypothetical protein
LLISLIIGAASGTLQFFLLTKFTGAVTGGKFGNKAVLFAITQFLLPLVVLLLSAFLLGEYLPGENFLMWIGIGMAASLIISAVVRYILVAKSTDSTKK